MNAAAMETDDYWFLERRNYNEELMNLARENVRCKMQSAECKMQGAERAL